jgi:Domain of unknown function (DUF5060)/Cellulase (glycosyl hydrolase family 5)
MYIKCMVSSLARIACYASMVLMLVSSRAMATGTYPVLEAAFDLPQVQGNPFDFTQNDVKVTFAGPDGSSVTLPAFFDGAQTWRVRCTPRSPGKYAIRAVTLNGQDAKPQNLRPVNFDVTAAPRPGFIRLDPENKMRFTLDDGSTYYPVGYNLGWHGEGQPSLVDSIAMMGHAGVNWTRIWMCYWDGKNLDWANEHQTQPKLGYLMLPVAKLWDQIVQAADANGVYFHMVLQHHGEYSTGADPNWQLNPWNKANGGWLDKPEQFFTDPKAIALTKSKFRYIIARWGYSPSIMAWELFNEVENTDAFKNDLDAVAAWHVEMASFIRGQDPYHHLITTSSQISEPKLWTAMDYYEAHVYPPDVLSAVDALDADHLDRAYFYGEFGMFPDPDPGSGSVLHLGLWASLMSQSSGAAQYWFWDIVEPNYLLYHYTAAQQFIRQSGMLDENLKPIEATPQTKEIGPLKFGPGSGWAPAKVTDFTVDRSGTVHGIGGMSSYLQGNGKNKKMFPYAVFHVNYPTAGTFSVHIDEITPRGARLQAAVDGQRVATLEFGPAPPPPPGAARRAPRFNPRPNATLELPIAAGEHTIRLEDTGDDWVHLSQFVLTPYSPQLGVLAKGNENFAVLWIYNRDPVKGHNVSGTLRVPGLAAGSYAVTWMDTRSGKMVSQQTVSAADSEPLLLATPPIATDMAAWITRPK